MQLTNANLRGPVQHIECMAWHEAVGLFKDWLESEDWVIRIAKSIGELTCMFT